MTRNKLLIIIGVIILGFVIALILFPSEYESKLKKVELTNDNLIINRSDHSYFEILYNKGFEIAGIKNERFVIRKRELVVNIGDNTILASVSPKRDYYLIQMAHQPIKIAIENAAHEIIHIQQMMSGDFIKGNGEIFWKGTSYKIPYQMDYLDIPWEREAINKSKALAKQMKEELLVKK